MLYLYRAAVNDTSPACHHQSPLSSRSTGRSKLTKYMYNYTMHLLGHPSATRLLFLWSILSVTIAKTSESPNANAFLSSKNNECYLTWIANHGHNYKKSLYLPTSTKRKSDESHGVAIHWSIDTTSETIRLAVAARAKGWVGFGIAEGGGMPGSDVVLFTMSDANLVDAHVGRDNGMPLTDLCQNWELLRSVSDGEFIIFEAERPLNTGDSQDRPILDDSSPSVPPHRIIAAWGDEDAVSYHGKNNRVRGAIRFHGESNGQLDRDIFMSSMTVDSEGFFDVTAEDYPLPKDRTKYIEPCFSHRHLKRLGLPKDNAIHVIGFEPLIGNAGSNLHHMGLVSYKEDNCKGLGVSVYIWAPGEGPFELPPDVGASIGEGSTMSYALQVHYNPTGASGSVDSSGVRLFYTSDLRRHELGFLEIGDPLTVLDGMVVGEGFSSYTFDCPATCTEGFDAENVTVLREMLHMHQKGARMVNQQIRDGEVIREATVEHYDYRYAGMVSVMQGSYSVKRGDMFKTTCYYDSDAETTFGFETENEMCIAFLLYYPKQDIDRCGLETFIPSCAGDYEVKHLSSISELKRSFGIEPERCEASDSNRK